MNTITSTATSFDVKDIEYLRHGSKPLLARVYAPHGPGPFPAIVELHGGAWTQFDRTRGKSLHEALARSGVVVAALDFRQGAEGAYPLSVADIHYGIRWLKANAEAFKTRSDLVGVSGNSTGGHLAMLVAMRPDDPRYASIALPDQAQAVDASLRCVVMLWPIINPLSRYHYAKRRLADPSPPDWAARIVEFHDGYWKSESNMADGSPTLLLERGVPVATPPALWIQASEDDVHNYRDPGSGFDGTEADRFVARYRRAGGEIELARYEAPALFTTVKPDLPQSIEALKKIVAFVHRTIPVPGRA
jgi:acetyl esterase